MNHSIKLLTLLICAAALVAAVYFGQRHFSQDTQSFKALKVYPNPRSFSGIYLRDHNDEAFTEARFKGHWSLVFFGYTHCPDVCPMTLTQMQAVYKKLDAQARQAVQFVFISVDPDRDTPEVMKNYVEYFNPEFVGVSGEASSILSITRQLGVPFAIEDHNEGELNYNVDHSAALFVINPDGQRHGLFQSPHVSDDIAGDLSELLR